MENSLKRRTHKILLVVVAMLFILGAIILMRHKHEYSQEPHKIKLGDVDKSVVVTLKYIDGLSTTGKSICCINKHYIDIYEKYQNIDNVSRCVVCDCGSTGTRIMYYEWHNNNPNTIEIVNYTIIPISYSSMTTDKQIEIYVRDMSILLMDMLGTGRSQKIPIYFLCTAGFRLLPTVQQQRLLNPMEAGLKGLWPHYQIPVNGVRIISGLEEGLNSWIGINLLKGTFSFINTGNISQYEKKEINIYGKLQELLKHLTYTSSKHTDDTHFTTIGMIEMGGASAQIGYTINKELADKYYKDNDENNRVYVLRLYKRTGKPFDAYLYISTKLGYGSSCALSQWHDHLRKDGKVLDPCIPKEMSDDLISYLGCTGQGNWNSCTTQLNKFLSTTDNSIGHKHVNSKWKIGPILKETDIKEIPKLFIGISLYYYVLSFLREDSLIENFERNAFIEYSKTLLEQSWPDIEANLTNHYDPVVIDTMRYNGATHGFKSAWILNLLYNVLQTSLDPSDPSYVDYQFLGTIEGKDLSWTYGVVIRDMMNLIDIHEYNPENPPYYTSAPAIECVVEYTD